MRKFRFTNGEFYHVYNRGVDKRDIFLDGYDFERFLQGMEDFNSVKPIGSIFEHSFRKLLLSNRIAKLVDVVCFCLNPNHYHMILRQRVDNGISEYMRRIGTGFTQHFNFKYHRTGVLLQGKFKAKHINSNEYLLHLSAYVNLNNKAHRIKGNKKFRSSWEEYFSKQKSKSSLCRSAIILEQFDSADEYRKFAESSLNDILERKRLFKEMEDLLCE
ncbi:MAG: transposase [Candidatus Giovannonibacteria bacterium]|nr:MAG: transposase [Candidatus Giovannonibacteria bacterium]